MAQGNVGPTKISVILSESVEYGAVTTDHAVEDGTNISDHTKANNKVVSVTGLMLGDDANARLENIIKRQKEGTLTSYRGRTVHRNMFISEFSPDYEFQVANGYKFSMELVEMRIAKAKIIKLNVVGAKTSTKVKDKTNGGNQQPSKSGHGGTSGLSLSAIAKEVYQGKWGNGRIRVQRLTAAGYNAKAVQAEVNRKYY